MSKSKNIGRSSGRTAEARRGAKGAEDYSEHETVYVDLSGIYEPALTLAFKNLQKRNATTKEKALDSLQAFVDDGANETDEAVLAVWSQFYPGLTAEGSRKIRSAAHRIQGELCRRLRKASLRYMGESVGCWLGGLWDSDKIVARSARASFEAVFNTATKRDNILKVFHGPILAHVQATLDADAGLGESKYATEADLAARRARALTSALALFTHLLETMDGDAIEERQREYAEIVAHDALWRAVADPDALLSRTALNVVKVVGTDYADWLDQLIGYVATYVLGQGLRAIAPSAMTDFLRCLSFLTKEFPDCWANPAGQDLRLADALVGFVARGSQHTGQYFWTELEKIVRQLPDHVLALRDADRPAVEAVVGVLTQGLNAEQRFSLPYALNAYLSILAYFATVVADADAREYIVATKPAEILDEYLTGRRFVDSVASSLVSFIRNIASTDEALARQLFTHIVSYLAEFVQAGTVRGAPLAADDCRGFLNKWFLLVQKLTLLPESIEYPIGIRRTVVDLSAAVLAAVKDQAGGSVPTAYALYCVVRHVLPVVRESPALDRDLCEFITATLPSLLYSASSAVLVDTWLVYITGLQDPAKAAALWQTTIEGVVRATGPADRAKDAVLVQILRDAHSAPALKPLLRPVPALEEHVLAAARLVRGPDAAAVWQLLATALAAEGYAVGHDVCLRVLAAATELVLDDDAYEPALVANLAVLAHESTASMLDFITTDAGSRFVSRVWQLTELDDEPAHADAKTIRAKLEGQLERTSNEQDDAQSIAQTLAEALLKDLGLDVEISFATLVARIGDLWEGATWESKLSLASQLVFRRADWQRMLDARFAVAVPKAVSLVSSLRGAVFAVPNPAAPAGEPAPVLFRVAIYVVGLLEQRPDVFDLLSKDEQAELVIGLQIAGELAKDCMSNRGDRIPPLSIDADSGADQLLQLVDKTRALLDRVLAETQLADIAAAVVDGSADYDGLDGVVDRVVYKILRAAAATDVPGYYHARVLAAVVAALAQKPGATAKTCDDFFTAHNLRRARNFLGSAAMLEGLGKYSAAMATTERLRNELASNIIGFRKQEGLPALLAQLALLNVLLHDVTADGWEPFPPQRAMLLLRRVLDLLAAGAAEDDAAFRYVRVEVFQLLLYVLPIVKGSYGEHWAQAVGLVLAALATLESPAVQAAALAADSELTALQFYALKLYGLLRAIHEDNDDLLDAFIEQGPAFKARLLGLLVAMADVDNTSQPRILCAALLSRYALDIKFTSRDNQADLYPILNTDCEPLQKTILKIQSRRIAEAREELLVEAALDSADVLDISLPFELLSFVMEAPNSYDPSQFGGKSANEQALRRLGADYQVRLYFYAWMLILEHFKDSSSKVRAKYIENLKEGDYVDVLLGTVFGLLNMQSSARMVDGSRFEVERYDPDQDSTEDPGRNLQWLVVHVYYLALYNVPSMCRSVWSDIRNRQLSTAVETFTQKYVSPTLIRHELSTVQDSLKNPEAAGLGSAEDNENIEIKVSKVTGDVTAQFMVDEYVLEMVIHVPEAFPLRDVYIEGPRRVGVKENQWRAWLLASQALINSQNGTILDALILFKRNFNLHFEGVTECAICYSILHQDRTLPNKRCQTCKNKFHAGCLYQWFRSSGQNTCPLCRTNFMFSR
ncbi:uncharacterized protein V1510DRAFT_431063 [Dipodascopsis tothii]|uniref:uncharacterized protein n=1 Tax=Dipodascopsis tothii TaxID=44089 RepID=UPI0034CF47C2